MVGKRIEGDSRVAIEVLTKDCAVIGDGEFGDMADLASATTGWEAGMLSKHAEEWVLASQAHEADKLRGFMLFTLERIGGTPAMIIGAGSIGRTGSRSAVLSSLMEESYHKALMAFPDEDVLVTTRLVTPGPLELFAPLTDVRPWPETRANGEERAWGRRLAKRYGATSFDDRSMLATADGDHLVFDHEATIELDGASILDDRHPETGFAIVWGWAMAEFLEQFDGR